MDPVSDAANDDDVADDNDSAADAADLDGGAELVAWERWTATWYRMDANGVETEGPSSWGSAHARPVHGDFDGDGTTDRALYDAPVGEWTIEEADGGARVVEFGWAEATPVPADYDGDGRDDVAVFHEGTWTVDGSADGPSEATWGMEGDRPVPADFDGDGRADLAVFRPATVEWLIEGADPLTFGWSEAWPVPADYDGDGRADPAVYHGPSAAWSIAGSQDGFWEVALGGARSTPVPADYDGDGRLDLAVVDRDAGTFTWIDRAGTERTVDLPWGAEPGFKPIPTRDAGHEPWLADHLTSPSGHFFALRGEPRMLLGDSGTQVVLQNLNVDYRAWIDQLAEEGHAGAQLWAFVAPRQRLDGSEVEERYGYVYPGTIPWARSASGPPATDGGFRWDLQEYDEGTDPDLHYWPRLRDICERLDARDMLLGVTVYGGWAKREFEYYPLNVANGGPATDRVEVMHLATDPGDFVYGLPLDPTWSPTMQAQWHWERLGLKYIELGQHCPNVWFDFRDEWSYENDTDFEAHFRILFLQEGAVWGDRSGLAQVYSNNGWNGVDVVPADHARGIPGITTEKGDYDPDAVLFNVWDHAMTGRHFMLHNDSAEPGVMAWDPVTAANHGTDPYADTARRYVGHASTLFNQHIRPTTRDGLVPRPDLVSGGSCMALDGAEYVVHVPAGGGGFTLDLTRALGAVDLWWFDPVGGGLSSARGVAGGAVTSGEAPTPGQPWVLLALVP